MKANELRAKKIEELVTELEALQKELFNLRMQKNVGEAPRPHNFKLVRRKIALVKTILNEKKRDAHE